mgnify:CR=1 FL=1
MLPQATLGAILCAVRIDFGLPSKINPYPAQPATGVLGQRPKRVLLTFARTKVSPRRVGVLIKSFIRLAPPEARRNQAMSTRRQAITDYITNIRRRRLQTFSRTRRQPRSRHPHPPKLSLAFSLFICYDILRKPTPPIPGRPAPQKFALYPHPLSCKCRPPAHGAVSRRERHPPQKGPPHYRMKRRE